MDNVKQIITDNQTYFEVTSTTEVTRTETVTLEDLKNQNAIHQAAIDANNAKIVLLEKPNEVVDLSSSASANPAIQ